MDLEKVKKIARDLISKKEVEESSKKTPFDYVLQKGDISKISKAWTKEEIKEKIATDNTWLYRGITAIYRLQTKSEQITGLTHESNGVGFNGTDANFMSSLAEQLIKRGTLSEKQTAAARKVMAKYAGQLARIANKNIEAEAA